MSAKSKILRLASLPIATLYMVSLFFLLGMGEAKADSTDLFDPGKDPPYELDILTGYYNWNYQESGDSDSAGMVPVRGRFLGYWHSLVYGLDGMYASTFNGMYNGALQGGTPFSGPMAETMVQGSLHLGVTHVFYGTRWDLWGSVGYHQQIWMTPAPAGYEEIYRIPFLGVTLYSQSPLASSIVFFSEIGYRSAFSPSVTVGLYDNPTLNLGGAWNTHGRIGIRYYVAPPVALSLAFAYSGWSFTQSPVTPIPNSNPAVSIQEPDSTTTWWGPEIGVTLNF